MLFRSGKDAAFNGLTLVKSGSGADAIAVSYTHLNLVNYLNDSGIDSEHRVDGSTIYLTIQ